MSYFPFFVEMKGKAGLIVGGGEVALHKIEKLLPYESDIEVVAQEFCEEIYKIKDDHLRLTKRSFTDGDVAGRTYVIAATDDEELNAHIYDLCMERRILVNVVDDRKRCEFMFPSLVKKGSLSIGISTEGASPRVATYYRRRIEEMVPDDMEQILLYLDSIRPHVKAAVATEKQRAEVFKCIADRCLDTMSIPDDEWVAGVINKYSC